MNKCHNLKNILLNINKNSLITSAFVVIILNFILKLLGLIFRIALTRILTVKLIGAYNIILPTLMLLLTISQLSLNITISKIISENIIKKTYSIKNIMISSIIIGMISSIITSIIVIFTSKYISHTLLHSPSSYIPLLSSVILIPVSCIDNILKGYFNGINKVPTSSKSKIIEELVRICLSIYIITNNMDKGIVFIITSLVICDSIGEAFSIFYLLIKLRFSKEKITYIPKSNNLVIKPILKMSFQTTLTSLIASILNFLEPIIYTFSLSINGYSDEDILYNFSVVSSYVIPMIITFSFIPQVISQILLPKLTQSFNLKKDNLLRYYTKKSITICLVTSIYIMVILTFYANDLLYLVYNKNYGGEILKQYSMFFILSYITPPIVSIMHATNNTKRFLIIQSCYGILKVVLIFIFANIHIFNSSSFDSIIIASSISSLIISIIYFIEIKKITNFKLEFSWIFKILILITSFYLFCLIITITNINFFISIFLSSSFYGLLVLITNILVCNDK